MPTARSRTSFHSERGTYTRLAAELTRDRFAKISGTDHAYVWFVQGLQTLTPRVFVGGRHESVSAPMAAFGPLAGTRPSLRNSEATLGYREEEILGRRFTDVFVPAGGGQAALAAAGGEQLPDADEVVAVGGQLDVVVAFARERVGLAAAEAVPVVGLADPHAVDRDDRGIGAKIGRAHV